MALPMRSTDFRAIVEPILNEAFEGIYDQRADEWSQYFDERTGIPRNVHEEPVLFGMGSAPELPDGQPVTYDSGGQLYTARYIYKVYGLAFALTKVLVEDGDSIRLGTLFSRHLAQSMVETKETLAANVLNRSFNASYLGGDNVSLVSASHLARNGTWSNRLTTDANLSQSSLEQMLIQIRQATDSVGKKIRITPKKLIVAPQNMLQAEVLLKSVLRTGSANNDVNPVVSAGLLDKSITVSRLTSATAWWIQTDAKEGMKFMSRRKLQKSMEGDFDTDSMRYKATERYAFGWTDPRAVYGTPGV